MGHGNATRGVSIPGSPALAAHPPFPILSEATLYLSGRSGRFVMADYSSTYLSGWEYNRILQVDPLVPRNSALPTEVLWNGAAPFWLFRTVYCTQEALANEQAGHDILGWTSGEIFDELVRRGYLEPLDWTTLKGSTKRGLVEARRAILNDTDEATIRTSIRTGDTAGLECAKLRLLQPIAEEKSCFLGVSPNSLRHWIKNGPPDSLGFGPAALYEYVSALAAPLTPSASSKGLTVCRPPGASVSEGARKRQEEVQAPVEAPMIPDLLAGDGDFGGVAGYIPYLLELEKHRASYEPINHQLSVDWQANRDRLFRLRDLAEKHLWPRLHGDWLPRLLHEPQFRQDFPGLLAKALRSSRFVGLLDMPTSYVVAISGVVSSQVVRVLARLVGLGDVDPGVTALVATAAGAAAGIPHARNDATRQLALFYQKGRKV